MNSTVAHAIRPIGIIPSVDRTAALSAGLFRRMMKERQQLGR